MCILKGEFSKNERGNFTFIFYLNKENMVKNVFIPKIVYRTCTKQIEVKLVAIDFEFNTISTYTRSFKKR